MVAVLPEELILSPFDSHQPAAVPNSKVILVQTVKLRNKLFTFFLNPLHVLYWYVYLHLSRILLRPEKGRLMRLYLSAISHALYQFLLCYCLYTAVACCYPQVLVIVHNDF